MKPMNIVWFVLHLKPRKYRANGRQHSHHWDEATEIKRIAAVNEGVSRSGQQRIQLKRIFENVREE